MTVDWYDRRNELEPGMVFTDFQGARVMLDRRVPGDGTRWYVADWWNGSWAYMDSTAEPGDLVELIADNDADGVCKHCGRDNAGYEADRCEDSCPIFNEKAKRQCNGDGFHITVAAATLVSRYNAS